MQYIAGYEVKETVSSSVSGSIFRATHPIMGRTVLIKTQPPEAAKSAEVHKRFQREIALAAQLTHPNLMTRCTPAGHEQCSLHGHGERRWRGPAIHGQSAGPPARRHGRRSAHASSPRARFLHDHGVIHRNIKPSNLILDKSGTVRITNLTAALISDEADVQKTDGRADTARTVHRHGRLPRARASLRCTLSRRAQRHLQPWLHAALSTDGQGPLRRRPGPTFGDGAHEVADPVAASSPQRCLPGPRRGLQPDAGQGLGRPPSKHGPSDHELNTAVKGSAAPAALHPRLTPKAAAASPTSDRRELARRDRAGVRSWEVFVE